MLPSKETNEYVIFRTTDPVRTAWNVTLYVRDVMDHSVLIVHRAVGGIIFTLMVVSELQTMGTM